MEPITDDVMPFPALVTSEQRMLNALGNLKATSARMNDLRTSLARLSKNDLCQLPDTRMLKVHTHLRTNGRKPTIACPEIILRGNWLERAGFDYEDHWVYVITMEEMIVIVPESKIDRRKRLG